MAQELVDSPALDRFFAMHAPGEPVRASRASLHLDAARVFVNDAALHVEASARQALGAMVEGDALRTLIAALRRMIKVTPINTAALRRRLADETVALGRYIFG